MATTTQNQATAQIVACLGCGGRALPIDARTVASVAGRPLHRAAGFAYCAAVDCDVVYSNAKNGEEILTRDLAVAVFDKSDDPSRPVCYCFGHTVDAVVKDAREGGRSSVAEAITDACRRGLDRCELTNPRGRCCLGNVRAVARGASANNSEPCDCVKE